MSNTALSSARRRRTGPAAGTAVLPQQQQQQQAQMQRLMEMQRQKQLLQQQQQQQPAPPLAHPSPLVQQPQPPYTQRMLPPQLQQPPQQPLPQMQRSPLITQNVKADTPVPPGYIKLLLPNGVYQMESVETGSVNFPYGEPHLTPTLILRNHDLDIIKLQGYHNDISNQLAHLTTMVTRNSGNGSGISNGSSMPQVPAPGGSIGSGSGSGSGSGLDETLGGDVEEHEIVFDEAIIHKITENTAFIANTVSQIMQNTNLSDLVTEVDVLKTENRELRSILNSQHEMMNGMNALLFNLLNKMHSSSASVQSAASSSPESEQPDVSYAHDAHEYKDDCENNHDSEMLYSIKEETETESESNGIHVSIQEQPSNAVEASTVQDAAAGADDDASIPRDWLP